MKKIILYILGIVLSVFGSGMFVCCTYGAITDKFQPIHVSDYWKNQWRILWGDAGAGAFFINSKKLEDLDFSDVLYSWDCC